MRWSVIAFLMACGGSGDGRKASAPDLRNVSTGPNAAPAHRESNACRDAIEAWYFAAGITPRTKDNEGSDRTRQQIFIDGCEQDGWSLYICECFEHLRVSVDRDFTSALSECKAMLTPEQLAGYRRRIEQTGDADLDKLD